MGLLLAETRVGRLGGKALLEHSYELNLLLLRGKMRAQESAAFECVE